MSFLYKPIFNSKFYLWVLNIFYERGFCGLPYKPIFNDKFYLWVLNILYGRGFCGRIREGAT